MIVIRNLWIIAFLWLGATSVAFSQATYVGPIGSGSGGGGGGTVTSVSVVSANGITGTVANPTTTPAITLTCAGGTCAPAASPTFTGTVTMPDTSTWSATGVNFLGTFSVASNLITWPATALTVARIDAGQTFIGNEIFQALGATGANATVNITTSTTASSNQSIQLQNDTSVATANIRVNNSASAGTTLVNVADAYVLTNGGTAAGGIYLGTSTNSAPIVFYTGGTVTATNTAMTISGTNQSVNVATVGSAATPSFSIGNSTTGLYSVSTTGLGFSVNGALKLDYGITTGSILTATGAFTSTGNITGAAIISNGQVQVQATSTLNWNSRGSLSSPAAAVVQLGAADAASPVAQTLQVQSVVAGTANTAGVNWTQQASLSTGTGTAGLFNVLTGFASLSENATITATSASPGVITYTAHGLVPGSSGQFSNSGGALPTGISAATTYFVCKDANYAVNTFDISLTFVNGACGTLINTSSTGSGTNTFTTNTTVQNPASAVVAVGPSGLTGSQTTAALAINQVWNTSGVAAAFTVSVTNIAAGASPLLMNLLAGATGTTSEFSVGSAGAVIAAGGYSTAIAGVGFSHSVSSSANRTSLFRNSSNNSAASYQIQIGNDTSASEATITLNSSGNSIGNPVNSLTINGAATMFLQGAGVNGLSFGASGAITLYNQATAVTPTYAVCAAANANGATGGQLDLDTSVTICGLSAMQFKKDIAGFNERGQARLASLDPIQGNMAPSAIKFDALSAVMALSPGQYRGDGATIVDDGLMFAIMAQDACAVDARICSRFPDGRPRTPIPAAMTALLVGAFQQEHDVRDEQIAALTKRITELEHPVSHGAVIDNVCFLTDPVSCPLSTTTND